MANAVILWQRLDISGHESARLSFQDSMWRISGTAIFTHDHLPCHLEYTIRCNSSWETDSAVITGWLGNDQIKFELRKNQAMRWTRNGKIVPEVDNCIDIDLNFSRSTNMLPIRRLNLAVGQSADVKAAWLRFPSFKLEPLAQTYLHLGESTYRYESGNGTFVTNLLVSKSGFVVDYPGFWSAEEILEETD